MSQIPSVAFRCTVMGPLFEVMMALTLREASSIEQNPTRLSLRIHNSGPSPRQNVTPITVWSEWATVWPSSDAAQRRRPARSPFASALSEIGWRAEVGARDTAGAPIEAIPDVSRTPALARRHRGQPSAPTALRTTINHSASAPTQYNQNRRITMLTVQCTRLCSSRNPTNIHAADR